MGKVIALMNEKGGVGKSALTFSCAWNMVEKGKRVLVVDMDGQKANITYLAGVKTDVGTKTIEDVLLRDVPIQDCIQSVPCGQQDCTLDIVPATVQMAALPTTAKMSKMKKVMREIKQQYDMVFLDVNPSPDWRHALTLSVLDGVGVVMLPDVLSLEANRGVFDSIEEITEGANANLKVLGIILNQFDIRTRLAKAVIDKAGEMAQFYGALLFATKVRKAVALSESAAAHIGVTAYAPASAVANDIRALTDELLEMMK